MPFQKGDVDKMKSSVTLFSRIAREASDAELGGLLQEVKSLLKARQKSS